MKKILFSVLIFLSFMSCDQMQDMYTFSMLSGLELTDRDDWHEQDFEDIKAVICYVNEIVEYDNDREPRTHVHNPGKTLKTGKGVCKDIAALELNVIYKVFGIKGQYVAVNAGRHIEKGGFPNHAEIRINGIVYNIYTGDESKNGVMYYYHFDEVFD